MKALNTQIKLILSTYWDVVYTELFNDPQRKPNMDYLPKTLIFALNEAHATNIVQIAKEVFGRNDDRFVQKITYSAGDSNELIRQFRNDKDFRIAVTCTLVATGTDVKPLVKSLINPNLSLMFLFIKILPIKKTRTPATMASGTPFIPIMDKINP